MTKSFLALNRRWVGVGEIPWDSPPKSGSHRTPRWREMDSNFRFPDAPSGRSAEARAFSSDREFAPLARRDPGFRTSGP